MANDSIGLRKLNYENRKKAEVALKDIKSKMAKRVCVTTVEMVNGKPLVRQRYIDSSDEK